MKVERLLRLPSGQSMNSVLSQIHGGVPVSKALAGHGLEGMALDDAMLYADEAETVEFSDQLDLRINGKHARSVVPSEVQAPITLLFGTPHNGVHETALYALAEQALKANISKAVYVNFRHNAKHGLVPRRLFARASGLKEKNPIKAELLSQLVLDLVRRGTQRWAKAFATLEAIPRLKVEYSSHIKSAGCHARETYLIVNPRRFTVDKLANMQMAHGRVILADTRVGSFHQLSQASHWAASGGVGSVRQVLGRTQNVVEQRLVKTKNGTLVAIRRHIELADQDRAQILDSSLKLSRTIANIAARASTWQAAARQQAPDLLLHDQCVQQLSAMDRYSKSRAIEAIEAIAKNTKVTTLSTQKQSTPNMSM